MTPCVLHLPHVRFTCISPFYLQIRAKLHSTWVLSPWVDDPVSWMPTQWGCPYNVDVCLLSIVIIVSEVVFFPSMHYEGKGQLPLDGRGEFSEARRTWPLRSSIGVQTSRVVKFELPRAWAWANSFKAIFGLVSSSELTSQAQAWT